MVARRYGLFWICDSHLLSTSCGGRRLLLSKVLWSLLASAACRNTCRSHVNLCNDPSDVVQEKFATNCLGNLISSFIFGYPRRIHLMSCGLNQDKRSLKVPVYRIRGLHGVRVETFSDASWTLDSLQAALQISIVDGQRALNVLRRPFELCNEHFSSKPESALEWALFIWSNTLL